MKKILIVMATMLLAISLYADKDFDTAFNLYKNQKYKQALPLFKKSQKPMSLFYIGAMFEKGFGVKKDIELAKRYYKLAADRFNIKEARHNYAYLLYTQYKYEQAYKEFEKNKNYFMSQYFLGDMLFFGKGVERDEYKGFYYLKKAAKKNYNLANIEVARIYLQDKNNPKKALKYIKPLFENKSMFKRRTFAELFLYASILLKTNQTKEGKELLKDLCKKNNYKSACITFAVFKVIKEDDENQYLKELEYYANVEKNIYAQSTLFLYYKKNYDCENMKHYLNEMIIKKDRSNYILNSDNFDLYKFAYKENCE